MRSFNPLTGTTSEVRALTGTRLQVVQSAPPVVVVNTPPGTYPNPERDPPVETGTEQPAALPKNPTWPWVVGATLFVGLAVWAVVTVIRKASN